MKLSAVHVPDCTVSLITFVCMYRCYPLHSKGWVSLDVTAFTHEEVRSWIVFKKKKKKVLSAGKRQLDFKTEPALVYKDVVCSVELKPSNEYQFSVTIKGRNCCFGKVLLVVYLQK